MKYQDKGVLFLFEQSYYYKIVNDLKIDYFDLINTGNWGYKGSEKLKKALIEKEDSIFNKIDTINSYVSLRLWVKNKYNNDIPDEIRMYYENLWIDVKLH